MKLNDWGKIMNIVAFFQTIVNNRMIAQESNARGQLNANNFSEVSPKDK